MVVREFAIIVLVKALLVDQVPGLVLFKYLLNRLVVEAVKQIASQNGNSSLWCRAPELGCSRSLRRVASDIKGILTYPRGRRRRSQT